MNRSNSCLLLLTVILLSSLSVLEAKAQFGTNLIVNGDAEEGEFVAVVGGFSAYTAPGWTTTSDFKAELYSEGTPNNINPNSHGPSDRGLMYFIGGGNGDSAATQSLAVASGALTIDSGQVRYNFSGWLGGYIAHDDNASLSALFLDSGGRNLLTSTLAPVLALERDNVSSMIYREDNAFVPAGTRIINVTLTMTHVIGFNNAVADNISLRLTPVPAPSALTTLLIGVIPSIGMLLRRRNK